MAIEGALTLGDAVRRAQRRLEHRPELPALILAAGAWLVLLAASGPAGQPTGHHHGSGLAADHDAWSAVTTARVTGLWVVMVVAMMVPLTVPSLRYVARMVPRAGRADALAAFGAGFVVAWLPGAVPAIALHGRTVPGLVIAAGFLAAAAWELGPVKRRSLLLCHRHRAVRASTPARQRSSWTFGLHRGLRCVASCGPAMAALLLCTHALLPLAALGVGLTVQQYTPDAHRYRVQAAAVLAALAVITPLST